ncbi:hypothetical protein BH24ACT2_BH24ACT2_03320 [soil metagenome]
MPTKTSERVLSWATDIDRNTILQTEKASLLALVKGHIALIPDAHVGKGATVGSVIPTMGAVIPAAVGVDIGCGMIAVETDLMADHLPDTLDPLFHGHPIVHRVRQGQPGPVQLLLAWRRPAHVAHAGEALADGRIAPEGDG